MFETHKLKEATKEKYPSLKWQVRLYPSWDALILTAINQRENYPDKTYTIVTKCFRGHEYETTNWEVEIDNLALALVIISQT